MATNLHIDPDLLERAQAIGGHRTKRETVNEALAEYIAHREQLKVLQLFGTVAAEDMRTDEEQRAQRKRA
ncbi:type II toxin-antitoxin system VapB family antitoxin [Deinococcus aquaedulcis]|uniref:type II toxin-antitoxin system VapB family antitoxin n=1 Tax=Deinococcus aquaedulcis TaxID=2840455 RepID=UPI001C82F3D6|nr:type II toxin-antitoxin system VapB family antitoxin [Deinococcus aquaedulcis]